MPDHGTGIGDAPQDRVIKLAPHQEQIGRRQDRQSDAAIRQSSAATSPGDRQEYLVPWTTAPPAECLGKRADLLNFHRVGAWAAVEMDVDIHIELSIQLENPINLPGPVDIVTRRTADDRIAILQRRNNVPIDLGSSAPTLLRKDAEVEVDDLSDSRPQLVSVPRTHATPHSGQA